MKNKFVLREWLPNYLFFARKQFCVTLYICAVAEMRIIELHALNNNVVFMNGSFGDLRVYYPSLFKATFSKRFIFKFVYCYFRM